MLQRKQYWRAILLRIFIFPLHRTVGDTCINTKYIQGNVLQQTLIICNPGVSGLEPRSLTVKMNPQMSADEHFKNYLSHLLR